MSSSTCSRIVRRPRAPVLRLSALRAIAAQRVLAELELDAFHVEQLAELLVIAFFGSVRILTSAVLVELLERRDDRQAADELGDQSELDQILGLDVGEQLADFLRCRSCCALRR